MKKMFKRLYLGVGLINAVFFGFAAYIQYRLLQSDEYQTSSVIVVAITAFLSSAILLMRAPYSKNNIDTLIVSCIRVATALSLCCVEWVIIGLIIHAGVSDSFLEIGVFVANIITAWLLLSMSEIREKYFCYEPPRLDCRPSYTQCW